MKLGDNIGNSFYNKDIPFVSDFVGEAFHSSDREEAYVMIKEAAMKAVDENLIHGSWEDRSRVAGSVVFEVFSAIYSAGALSAAKAGDKAGDAGRTSKLLNKVSDVGGE